MFDDSLRSLVSKEWKIGKITIGFLDILLLIGMTWMGIAIRVACKDIETMDYTICIKPWVDELKKAGSFRGIVGSYYDYTPPYMYVLYLVSLLPMEPLYPVKIVSSIFDFILAIVSGKMVYELTGNRMRSFLAYGIIFCLPTVAVNSGLWGQCDAIYVTFVVSSLYLLFKGHSNWSMLCYGMAFAIKLQSLFIFPLYVFFWVVKKYKIWQFLYLPLVYLVMCIPSALAGQPIKDLLLVYVGQGNTEPWMLSWHWPNIYLLFGPTNFYESYSTVGIFGTMAILMLLLYFLARRYQEAGKELMLQAMLMFALVTPFFLPYMHERYGYLADILAVIFLFVRPSRFYIAVTQVLLSYTAYTGYLHGASTVPQPFYCFVMAALVTIVTVQVFVPDWEKKLGLTCFHSPSAISGESGNQES